MTNTVRLVLERDEGICCVCGQPGADTACSDPGADNPGDFANLRAIHTAWCRRPDPATAPTTSRDW